MTAFTLAAGAVHDRSETVPPWLRPFSLPNPSAGEYQLQPLDDGYTYEELTFTARIARDGVVTFKDRLVFFDRLLFLHENMPGALSMESFANLAFARPRAHLRSLSVRERGPFPGSPADPIAWDVLCPEPSTCYALPGLLVLTGVNVNADLTDEILHTMGQDPYRVQKARFLAATLDVRMRLAVQAQRDDLQISLEQLPERLAELWHDTRYPATERRHILFELWRETDESEAGAQARDIILTFIRRILPCGSPEAYSPAELHALQAGEAGRTFSPYGACGR
jgi:hypothetical protein